MILTISREESDAKQAQREDPSVLKQHFKLLEPSPGERKKEGKGERGRRGGKREER